MEKNQQDYVDGVRLWIKAQENLAMQVSAAVDYNEREVYFHRQAIENDKAMLKHYVAQLDKAKAELETYLNENPE